jgi:hypothetical protein
MPQIIARINYELAISCMGRQLRDRDNKQCYEMQRIKPRKSENEELLGVDDAMPDGIFVLIEEHEAGEDKNR